MIIFFRSANMVRLSLCIDSYIMLLVEMQDNYLVAGKTPITLL